MSILGRWMILRAVALEFGRAPNRNASRCPRSRGLGSGRSPRLIFSAGCCFIKAGSRGMISLSTKLDDVPTRSEPRTSPVPRASWSASSSAARIASTRIRYVAPASVSVTARVVRLKSVAPTSSSSAAISRDADGCDRPSSRPALEKLPTRAARANSLSAES